MQYNPEIHHRHSIRYPGYDYRQPGAYFVTLCVQDKAHLFGAVIDDTVHLSAYGTVVDRIWRRILQNRPDADTPVWVVMPNHFHAIVLLTGDWQEGVEDEAFWTKPAVMNDDSAKAQSRQQEGGAENAPSLRNAFAGSLGTLIGNFKSVSTRRINQLRDTPKGKVWQSNYYDRIIRNEGEYHRIAYYIEMNPATWEKDTYFEP